MRKLSDIDRLRVNLPALALKHHRQLQDLKINLGGISRKAINAWGNALAETKGPNGRALPKVNLRNLAITFPEPNNHSPAYLESMPKLEQLFIEGVGYSDRNFAAALAELNHLRELELIWSAPGPEVGKSLASLPKLEQVEFTNSQPQKTFFRELGQSESLKSLTVYSAPVTDRDLQVFARASQLEELILITNGYTDKGIQALG